MSCLFVIFFFNYNSCSLLSWISCITFQQFDILINQIKKIHIQDPSTKISPITSIKFISSTLQKYPTSIWAIPKLQLSTHMNNSKNYKTYQPTWTITKLQWPINSIWTIPKWRSLHQFPPYIQNYIIPISTIYSKSQTTY